MRRVQQVEDLPKEERKIGLSKKNERPQIKREMHEVICTFLGSDTEDHQIRGVLLEVHKQKKGTDRRRKKSEHEIE